MEDVDDMSLEVLQAMAMMSRLGGGATKSVDQLLSERPDLQRRLKRLDPIVAAASFGALLTVPDLQANATRIEALVRLSLAMGEGRQKIADKVATDAFRHLGKGICGHMEDPAEDLFVGSVRSPWGNFRVLEGLWEGATFYAQLFVDLVASMPAGPGYDQIRACVAALLRLSDEVCARARLGRHELGGEMPLATLPKKSAAMWLLRRRHLRFTSADLASIGLDRALLHPFAFDLSKRTSLLEEAVDETALERSPIIFDGDLTYLVLPTAVSSSIRYFVISKLQASGMGDQLAHALAARYATLISETPLLGGKRPPRLRFHPGSDAAFAETMTEVDKGRYLHFLFFTDSLAEVDETGLTGVNPSSATIGIEFDRRIEETRRSVSGRQGFREGLTLVVGCGIGRGAAIVFGEEELADWKVESCSAYDLMTLSWAREFRPLALWRILDARNRAASLGLRLQNINGLINLVAWARELDGHIVPHGRLPDNLVAGDRSALLAIDQNRQRSLRHEVAVAQDTRVEQFIDGRWIRVRRNSQSIFAQDQAAPSYASEEPGPSGFPMAVYISPARTWWADVTNPDGTSTHAGHERWRNIGVWLQRAAPMLDQIRGLPPGPIFYEIEFGTAPQDRTVPRPAPTYEKARKAFQLEVDGSRGSISVKISDGFEAALFHPENIAERALVAALVRGAAELAESADSMSVERELTARIVPNTDARNAHAFLAQSFRDHVRPSLMGEVTAIGREDDAYTRLGLAWNVRERAPERRLAGKEECTSFLNSLVTKVEDDIIGDLRRFERRAMLELLLRNHELGVVDRERWRRTSAAMIGLHGDTPETSQTIYQHEFKLNAIFQSSRILVEMALCECPLAAGLRPGRYDMTLLMAKAALLFELGGWSDAIRWDLMRPELRLTPLGDVHAFFEFHEEVVLPHARATAEGRIAEAVDSYGANFSERPVEVTVAHKMEKAFAEAWTEQFGATVDETRVFIDFVENLGVEAGLAILAVPASRFRKVGAAGQRIDDAVSERLVERLTLTTRPSWRVVPAGFEDRDWHPWRLRRRLSILRRPLLQIDEKADPTILVAPGMVRDAFGYMLGNFYRGDFADQQLTPKMRAWKARAADTRGSAFSAKVAEALDKAGWETRSEVAVTNLLGRGFDRNYGDVDVLAWRRSDGRVLIIECKDVQFRKTYGEIAEQLADFRGGIRPNGKPDYLRRHLDRVDLIRANLDAVSRFTGLAPSGVESHLVFRHPVPMEFALKKMAEKVIVSRFDLISQI